MKQLFLSGLIIFALLETKAQKTEDSLARTPESPYQASSERINDLVHTKLNVSFDYEKAWMYGKAWLTLRPHFYDTDSLRLDAKGMTIKEVSLVTGTAKKAVKFTNTGLELRLNLGKSFTRNDKYTIYIEYISKPNELVTHGSTAIKDAKGLYFINPKGEDKKKPTQIWTQGETEATSVWCPTIDKPNQKTTVEITMTVPSRYVTLSNGRLTLQKKNSDGTRSDTWKMDKPHAPYLFFMGVGDFAVIKDKYKGKEVSYYVEKAYAPYARKIFGNTPEMIAFYEKILNYPYPWNKYAQMVGRDYVSGAMENTTATLHQENAQQDGRELIDDNIWEGTIAHELFHQWFGDLVTSESWSNLTLNESFANYSQVLWKTHKYGKDAGDEENFSDMFGYLQSHSEKKKLVRYYYDDKESMFDAVSYNKGGRILHMLRNYVGDSAFYKSLNLYLTTNKYKSAEAHQLRLAFEEVTGQDLNWFWNQWYFGNGHPKLTIDYKYNDSAHKVNVVVKQTQEEAPFRLPIAVDIYEGKKKTRHKVWLGKRIDTLTFSYTKRPDLINVDGDKILLVEKTDNKSIENFIHQYTYAGSYLDRKEAIDAAAESSDPEAVALVNQAMKDRFYQLRIYTINKLNMRDPNIRTLAEPVLYDLATSDSSSLVRSAAIGMLGPFGNPKYQAIFEKGVNDSSYSVAGASLDALLITDSSEAFKVARTLSANPAKGRLQESINKTLLSSGDESVFDKIEKTFDEMPLSQSKFNLLRPLGDIVVKMNNTDKVKRGIDMIVKFRDEVPKEYGITPYLNEMLNSIAQKIQTKSAAGSDKAEIQEQVNYVKGKLESK